jgi:hypothetical protein
LTKNAGNFTASNPHTLDESIVVQGRKILSKSVLLLLKRITDMKTLLTEELQEQPHVKLAVGFAALLLLGFVVTGVLLYFQHMDFSPSSVVSYYTGSDQEYRPAWSYQALLEVSHGHTVVMAVALLLLSLLLVFSRISSGAKRTFIIALFSSALLNEAASWLIRFVADGFAWLKILAFLTLQIGLVVGLVLIVLAFFQPARKVEEPVQEPQQHPRPHQGGYRGRRRRPRRRGGGGGQGGQRPRQGPQPPRSSQ